MTTPRPRGAPPFKPTPTARQDVKLLKADGWSDERIARCLQISKPTLYKYFAWELEFGADQEKRETLRALKQAVKKKSVPAIREMFKIIGITHAAEEFLDGAATKPVSAPKLGKKEQAEVDARTPDASTEMGELMARRGALH